MVFRTWRSVFTVSALVGLLASGGAIASASGAGAAGLRIARDDSTLSILDGSRLVLRYRFGGVPYKPYADQLFSPAGVEVLRDSPRDHKHHHGLMYALTVDDVNFWEEFNAKYGREVQRSLSELPATVQNGVGRAGLSERLDWVGPDGDSPLLVEQRTVEVLQVNEPTATLVQWRCRLQTPPGKATSTITGHHYFGIGMRFVESMDKDGRFFNADAVATSETVRGTEQLTPVKWCAYTAKADGRQVTVALFDHPGNLRHPARMFTMSKPFAYLSATMNEWKEPVIVKAGDPLKLCYGVAVWDGEADKAAVEALYQKWLTISNVSPNTRVSP